MHWLKELLFAMVTTLAMLPAGPAGARVVNDQFILEPANAAEILEGRVPTPPVVRIEVPIVLTQVMPRGVERVEWRVKTLIFGPTGSLETGPIEFVLIAETIRVEAASHDVMVAYSGERNRGSAGEPGKDGFDAPPEIALSKYTPSATQQGGAPTGIRGGDGEPGRKGADGQKAGNLTIQADAVEGVLGVDLAGQSGGPGGRGGRGGNGGMGPRGMGGQSALLACLQAAGAGGPGGEGGRGGDGGDGGACGPAGKLTTKFPPEAGAIGNLVRVAERTGLAGLFGEGGVGGRGGRGGNAGELSPGCAPGGHGDEGKDGAIGRNGTTPSAPCSRTTLEALSVSKGAG